MCATGPSAILRLRIPTRSAVRQRGLRTGNGALGARRMHADDALQGDGQLGEGDGGAPRLLATIEHRLPREAVPRQVMWRGGPCVRRAEDPARRFRHQTGCGNNQAQTIEGEAVAGARGVPHRAGACESHSQGRRRSTGGEGRSDPVFQPSNGGVTQSNEPPKNPGRFS